MRKLVIFACALIALGDASCTEGNEGSSGVGEACVTSSDCSGSLFCHDGVCHQPGTKGQGEACAESAECVGDLDCIEGICDTIDPTLCTAIACNPPTCCGDSCTAPGTCCSETICVNDRCIPEECAACSSGQCTVDFETCEANCEPPACCLDSCSGAGDCCPGTQCLDAVGGGKNCFPTECDSCDGSTPVCAVSATCEVECQAVNCCLESCTSDNDCCEGTYCAPMVAGSDMCVPDFCQGGCGGMTPSCDVSADCSYECAPPSSCGTTCGVDGDCGSGSNCQTFDDGVKKCVPDAFAAACGACSYGCSFYDATCTIECIVPDPCCDQSCTIGGTDCCPGTSCEETGSGPMCVPADCSGCGGMTPACAVQQSNCSFECVAPDTCGDVCAADTTCGSGSHCQEFLSGNDSCVPDGFLAECSACGETCWFFAGVCEVRCEQGEPDPTTCKACCEACTADTDCCAGSICGTNAAGDPVCVPEICNHCGYGCTYACPP